MKRNLLHSSWLTLGLAISSISANAQQYYNQTPAYLNQNSVWTMYSNIKLNMNSGAITYPLAGIGGDEGVAAVADPNTGALLFYSDGGSCWNQNDAIMPNGTGLLGNSINTYYSTTQGVCIVPMPGDAQKYYLFSLESSALFDAPTSLNLYYSIVDMSLDNGIGDIVSSSKNTVLDGNSMLSESMVAIQGNNCDVWLLVHTRQTPTFKAYHITAEGIDPTPVISTTGSQIQGTTTINFASLTVTEAAYAQSSIAISPDRTKLTVSCQSLGSLGIFPVISSTGRSWGGLLCDFNAATGEVSNALLIDTMGQSSTAFSPDGSKLYYATTSADVNANFMTQIMQIDISSNDSASIVNSATALLANPQNDMANVKLYNDTIYITNRTNLALDRINQPNLAGTASDYQSAAITFSGAAFLGYSLPNEIVGAAAPDTTESIVLDTLVCSNWANGIALQPADPTITESYLWSTGATDNTISVTTAGTYWVKYSNSCHSRVDTFILNGIDLNPIITVDEFVLGTTTAYNSYQWCLDNTPLPGATDATYTVTENGDYTVIVSNGTCTDTADIYTVTNFTSVDQVNTIARQIKVYPNPSQDMVHIQSPVEVNLVLLGIDGRIIKELPQATQISLADLAGGIYMLQITDKDKLTLKIEKLIKQ